LTIAQGFSLAYQSWQAVQVPVKREKEMGNAAGNVVVTKAVVEKQPVAAEESIATTGDSVNYSKYTKYKCKELQHQGDNQRIFFLIGQMKRNKGKSPGKT
jgi:hypothetical protein